MFFYDTINMLYNSKTTIVVGQAWPTRELRLLKPIRLLNYLYTEFNNLIDLGRPSTGYFDNLQWIRGERGGLAGGLLAGVRLIYLFCL